MAHTHPEGGATFTLQARGDSRLSLIWHTPFICKNVPMQALAHELTRQPQSPAQEGGQQGQVAFKDVWWQHAGSSAVLARAHPALNPGLTWSGQTSCNRASGSMAASPSGPAPAQHRGSAFTPWPHTMPRHNSGMAKQRSRSLEPAVTLQFADGKHAPNQHPAKSVWPLHANLHM